MANRYWESEGPLVVQSKKNVLRYFRQAQKLQVSLPQWPDAEGQVRQGKTVTLDLKALAENQEAVDLLQDIV